MWFTNIVPQAPFKLFGRTGPRKSPTPTLASVRQPLVDSGAMAENGFEEAARDAAAERKEGRARLSLPQRERDRRPTPRPRGGTAALTPGRLADCVVLSRDILDDAERDRIAETEVAATVVGGRVVYEKE